MRLYRDKAAVIIDLHERGFTEDFQVAEGLILWIQRKLFLKPNDFSLVEAHSFIGNDGNGQLVMGVNLLSHFANGILIWQFDGAFEDRRSSIIQWKNSRSNHLFPVGMLADPHFHAQ